MKKQLQLLEVEVVNLGSRAARQMGWAIKVDGEVVYDGYTSRESAERDSARFTASDSVGEKDSPAVEGITRERSKGTLAQG